MRRIVFMLLAVAAVAGVVAYMAPASGQADKEAAPIFVTEIPPGHRDWRLVSVAHEEGNLHESALRSWATTWPSRPTGKGSFRFRTAPSSPASHCGSRPVGGEQQGLRPRPILRSRPPHGLVPAVHGQGLRQRTPRRAAGGTRHFDKDGKPGPRGVKLKTCYPCHAQDQGPATYVFTQYAP